MIQLSFLGSCNEVARSAILLDDGINKILFDYGSNISEIPPLHPKNVRGRLDAIFLSHSHLDHSGSLPLLFKNGQECPVFTLEINKRLCRLLLQDSLKIARLEGYDLGFEKKHIKKTLKKFVPLSYKDPIKFTEMEIIAYDAGHLPGSSMFFVNHREKNILYTGDFNPLDTRLLKGCNLKFPHINILITESTYAQREHPNRKKLETEFVELINDTCANGGVALVAGFAVGRLQEILLILEEYKVDYPIYMDGMAKKATNIIADFPNLLKSHNKLRKAFEKVDLVSSQKKRNKLIKEACIILTTSGMLQAGPVVNYIKKLHKRKDCTLFLTGFQVKGSPGRTLLETGRYINKDLNLKVKMFVKYFDFSSHVGRKDLFKSIEKINPEKIFCVHGDNAIGFSKELKERGFDATAPTSIGESFTL
jgi:putative mRNA 3-end processing factor